MDPNGLSALQHMRSKVGKVRRRVQDLRNPACSRSAPPAPDLGYNESVRLAADALLSRGAEGYRDMLTAEGEVDFLSAPEKSYILENGRDANAAVDDDDEDGGGGGGDEGEEVEGLSAGSQFLTGYPAASTDSDPSELGLDLNWPDGMNWTQPELGPPSVEVHFQTDNRAACMKDLVREFIRKATTVVAIVMDTFSDVELLCDLLEARKKSVSVYLLLDHLNLDTFLRMCEDLKVSSQHLTRLLVRSVEGQTYCATSGRRLTGQIAENFIITDWTEVLSGSYSFSWLSWQVHRSLAVLFKGGAVTPFRLEFRRLFAGSKPVPSLSPPPYLCGLPLTSLLTLNRTSGPRGAGAKPNRAAGNRTERPNPLESRDAEARRAPAEDDKQGISGLSKLQLTERERDGTDSAKTPPKSTGQAQARTRTDPRALVQITDGLCGVSSVGKEQRVAPAESPEERVTHGPSGRQAQTQLKPPVQTETQPRSNPLLRADVPVGSSAEQGIGTKHQTQPLPWSQHQPFTPPPPRLYWSPKRHASNTQPLVPQRSFANAYGTRGWRNAPEQC